MRSLFVMLGLLLLTLSWSAEGWTMTTNGSKAPQRTLQRNNRATLGRATRPGPALMAKYENEAESAADMMARAEELRAQADKAASELSEGDQAALLNAVKEKKEAEAAAEASSPKVTQQAQKAPTGVSKSMKEKLRAELASQGAYEDRKAGNPILIIAAIVGVLVVLGGKDIFYGLPPTVGLEDVLRHAQNFSDGMVA